MNQGLQLVVLVLIVGGLMVCGLVGCWKIGEVITEELVKGQVLIERRAGEIEGILKGLD